MQPLIDIYTSSMIKCLSSERPPTFAIPLVELPPTLVAEVIFSVAFVCLCSDQQAEPLDLWT